MSNSESNNLLQHSADHIIDDDESSDSALAYTLSNDSSNPSIQSISELSNLINPKRSFIYIIILTIVIGGLQLSWCTEFSEGTPFLLSLGISKHTLALVWIAGPMSGTLGQPIVGIFSDNCTSAIGRRRPFIIGGCIATCLSLFYLSHSIDIIKFFVGKDHKDDDDYVKNKTIPFASLGVYLLDFSISCIQAATRAFIIDNVSTNQQQIANAWAARMIGFFNIFGYWLSSIELTKLLPSTLGDSQFKVLASIAAICLLLVTTISCFYIQERNPRTDIIMKTERKKQQQLMKSLGINQTKITPFSLIKSLWKQTINSVQRLSPQVKLVNLIEFLAWVGYFPMLFYTTTYVGELYQQEWFDSKPPGYNISPDEKKYLLEESTRRGSIALLVHAITSLIIDLVLPVLIRPHNDEIESIREEEEHHVIRKLKQMGSFRTLTVAKIWNISHLIFVLCMISTFWINTSTKAIVMFGILGIPWGVALWAPFVLISEEISRIKEIKTKGVVDNYSMKLSNSSTIVESNPNLSSNKPFMSQGYNPSTERLNPTESASNSACNFPVVTPRLLAKYEEYSYEPGIILGIHNVAVALPQVFSSLMSSFLFAILSNGNKFGEFDPSLGWVYRFGGLVTIGAWILSFHVKTWEELMEDDLKEIESEES